MTEDAYCKYYHLKVTAKSITVDIKTRLLITSVDDPIHFDTSSVGKFLPKQFQPWVDFVHLLVIAGY